MLCSVNVCDHPSFHPCPLWRFTQSFLLQIPSSHGAPPPQFAHHRDPPPSHRLVQRQAGVLSQWHRLPQQLVSSLYTFQFSINPMPSQAGMHTLTSDPSHSQETSGCKKRGGKEEAATHKETSECVHALHEGNESQSGGRVHTERERSYQPDPRPKGECLKCTMQSSSRLSKLLRPQIAVLSAVEKHYLFTFLFLCNRNLAQCCYWVNVQYQGKGKL